MRKPLIAGNWKMHGSTDQVESLLTAIVDQSATIKGIDVAVIPTFVHLVQAQALIKSSQVQLGAQNVYIGEQGAFTGEVSAAMLADIGCRYVLIGHSERRHIFGETLSQLADKFKSAVAAGLQPILCVGETQQEREAGETTDVVYEQIQSIIDVLGINAFEHTVIAYEPVWAIGTGLTATPEQAQAVHADIRQLISQNQVDLARTMRILYGGSMKPDNAASLLAMPDIDGGLIGGASLKADSFIAICEAAQREVLAA